MLKKTITYTDYNGEERKEDFYFNLTHAEIAEMELSVNGGLTALIEKVVAAKDYKNVISIFKDPIVRSYGEKSLDGKRFIKNQELTDAFTQTEAYSQLFMELATDSDAAANFIKNIVPKDMQIDEKKAEQIVNT